LLYILNGIDNILSKNLIGLYLFGSLTYGDFKLDSSDIDLVTIIQKPLNHPELEVIKQLHEQFKQCYQKWGERLECSYTPVNILINILSPKEPRPYFGSGTFYDEATYGNEWIINNYLLYQHGISLIGPDFKELIKPIDIIDLQKACVLDLFQEWEPKMTDFEWIDNSHYQSYLVMNLCRNLYTVLCGKTATKNISAAWVKNKFVLPWSNLIENAASWKYGKNDFAKRSYRFY
jgi:hypothetical protein